MSIFKNYYLSIGILLLFMVADFSCTHHSAKDRESLVLAQVGNQKITVHDFRLNYEFGFPHLKKAPDRKRSYLNYMIKEKILSLAGYQMGLDKNERVQKLEKELLNELLIEELFRTEVDDKIKITPKEIHDAINKSKISWKLRYWVDSNFENASRVGQAMRQSGYSTVVQDILRNNPEVKLSPKDFETKYLTWLEVSPELLNSIKNLKVGEISDPVKLDGAYFIFQIVDIRRKGILEKEYLDKTASIKKVLFYRKSMKESLKYISDFMTPKNVVTKGGAFFDLTDALLDWRKLKEEKQTDFLQAVESADTTHPYLFKLKNKLSETLVTFKGGRWTIKDFLDRFDPKKVRKDSIDPDKYRKEINQQIALCIRNYFLLQKAKADNLIKSPEIQKQLHGWQDKWVYQETKNYFTRDITVTKIQAKKYFERFKDRYKIGKNDRPTFAAFRNQAIRDAYFQKEEALLNSKIDSLKMFYPVKINESILDTVNTNDSKKSRWMSLQVFKRNSNRQAVPVVDPAWGF